MLLPATLRLVEMDLRNWKAAGSVGPPVFGPVTISAVDADTNGKGTRVVALLNATPINWQQIITELLPILIQLIPILIALFGGGG